MTRRPRIHYPGALYHVIARGVEKRRIFLCPEDFKAFTSTMTGSLAKFGARLFAYCLMPNHVHMAIKVGVIPLSRPMHRILGCHALTFNEKYERSGHLFQGRHSAYLVTNEAYLSNLIRYIHQNPVRAKLSSRPQDWPWSSCTDDPREEEAIPEDFDPYFGQQIDESDQSLLRIESTGTGASLDEIGIQVSVETGIAQAEFRSRSKRLPVMLAKRMFAERGVNQGFALAAIARWIGVSDRAVAKYVENLRIFGPGPKA